MKNCVLAPCALGFLTLFAWGCDGPVAADPLPNAAGSGSASPNINGGSSGAGSDRGGRPDPRPDPIEELPGVDEPLEVPPDGCLGGFEAGALTLRLNADVPSVRIEESGGKLLVNGSACTSEADVEVELEGLSSLTVTGSGAQRNAVILELGSGDWSALLDAPESIQLELGDDENSVVVRGTSGPDVFRHGMRGPDFVLDLVGDGRINVVGRGVTEVGVSLAGGDDRLDDLAELLRVQAAQAAAEESPPEDPEAEIPEAEEPVPVVTLSLRLVAAGGEGNDRLLGGSGGDDFDGGLGNDLASGLLGDDTFRTAESSDGADTIDGGLGYDEVSYELRTGDLLVQVCSSDPLLACNTMSGETGENDRLINVEDITGGEGNDTLRGSDAAESLSGGPGDDNLYGLGGSDILYGQRGDDLFEGGLDGDYCDAQSQERVSGCEL